MESAEIEQLVGELETRVDRLRALYEQYFMGIEKIVPSVPHKDVDRRIQVLRKEQIRNTAVRFRFQMIIQRYNTYQTHWQRICRQIEEGTYKRDMLRAQRRLKPAPTLDDADILEVIEPAAAADAAPAAPPPVPRAAAPIAPPAFQPFELDPLEDFADLDRVLNEPPPAPVEHAPAAASAPARAPAPAKAPAAPPVPAPAPSTPAVVRPAAIPGARPLWRKVEPKPAPGASPPAPAAPQRPPAAGASPAVLHPPASRPLVAPAAAKPAAPPPAAAPRPRSPADLSDARLRQLYSEYVQTRRKQNESTAALTYDALAKSLRESSEKLREKHGKSVDFEVTVKDGKTILKPVVKR